jgi:energy-coupling factor transporter ATP-binding protein EcfA2
MHNKLHQLSGGEQQRVAIAISLSNRPRLLLADEPTGSVDTTTSDLIMGIFRQLNREIGITVVIVTHDLTLAGKVDRVVAIRDGLTSTEFIKRNPNINLDGGEAELPQASGLQAVHEAYVVVDRVGRLQVPKEYLSALHIKDKATMEFDGERIIITPPKSLGG